MAGCATQPGELAPNWTLTDSRGIDHSMSDYRGKVVVLDFWATWCAPCRPVGKAMQQLHTRFADNDVAVLAIHFNSTGDPEAYMKENNYTYTSLRDGREVCQRYGVSQIPTILLVNRDGVVIHRQTGFRNDDTEQWIAMIDEALNQP